MLIRVKNKSRYRKRSSRGSKVQNGWCVWVTGLPGSGKSVVSQNLLQLLEERGIHAQILSSDALRKVLTPNPTYSVEERDMVYNTLVYIAKLLTQNHVNVIIDATGNLQRYRQNAREQISQYIEVYLKCPLQICIQRETKRQKTYEAPEKIYKKAFQGKTSTVPGIGQPYQTPKNPEITIDTTKNTPKKNAQQILTTVLNYQR